MKKLHLFYDQDSPFCRKCKNWLIRQPAFMELELLPIQARSVRMAYPEVAGHRQDDALIVLSDTGLLYTGDDAWITVLWALHDWRDWSLRLQQPDIRPLARQFWQLIGQHPESLAGLPPETATLAELRSRLEHAHVPA